MNLTRIIALLIYTFGVFAYGSLLVAMFRRPVNVSCMPSVRRGTSRQIEIVGGAIFVLSFLWFCVALLQTLVSLDPDIRTRALHFASLILVFLFPPLIMHITYADTQYPERRLRHPAWRVSLWASYIVSQSISLTCVLGFMGVLGLPRRVFGPISGLSIGALFAIAAIYAILATSKGKKKAETSEERSSRRSMSMMYVFVLLLVVLIVVASLTGTAFAEVLRFVASCLPLAFLFVAIYHEDRFEFFDLFIKRGLSLLLTIILLTSYFGLVLPRLEGLKLDWARPWAYAVLLLPVAMSLPWLYRKLGYLLDNFWLGRRFTTVEAVKHFLSGLQSATNERELVERAETGLSTIFQASTRIDLELRQAPSVDFDCAVDVPILSGDQRLGAIFMGRRTNHAPYFSEDTALLGSLADVFSYMLENIRLQQKKQEQEKRAKELSLHASQSELKALRAQINPHFLFNALNAIASLIHKDPLRADRTVEQLAEVFRYTLRGSETEWALLDDEMDFVRAYLQVEQARFGQRLQVSANVEEQVKQAKVPTMIVQTLVENAVKHGVAAVRGPATIEVDARLEDGRLMIHVADNGPGFDEERDLTPLRTGQRKQGTGYGLKNVRQRLQGYFGENAELVTRRDEARAMTVVCIVLPFTHDAPSASLKESDGTAGSQGAA